MPIEAAYDLVTALASGTVRDVDDIAARLKAYAVAL